jgi:hypothetical protein
LVLDVQHERCVWQQLKDTATSPPPHSVGDAGGGSSRDVGDTTTTLIQILASASSTGALFYGLLVVPSGLHAHEEATS